MRNCRAIIILLLCLLLAGCSVTLPGPAQTGTPSSSASSGLVVLDPEPAPEPEPAPAYAPVDTAAETFPTDQARRAAEHIDPAVNAGIALLNAYPDDGSVQVLDFDPARTPEARDGLSEEELAIYELLLAAVSDFGDFAIEESELSKGFATFVHAEDALRFDHPELFLCYQSNTNRRTYTPLYFTPNQTHDYVEDRQVCRDALAFYEAVFSRILACMPEGLTNWQKCLYFSGVILACTEYETAQTTSLQPFQAYNSLVTGCAICQGYTQAFRLLCRAAGVDCQSMPGLAQGGDHIWNALETAEGLRFVDLTFTDSWCRKQDTDFTTRYFFIDEEELDFLGYEPQWDHLE